MTMVALLMTLCVECNTNETLVDLLRRRPGIPPKFLGYMEDTSIEPGQKPPRGALSQDRERINHCPSLNPFLTIEVDTKGPKAPFQSTSPMPHSASLQMYRMCLTVRGDIYPDEDDWIAVTSPSEFNFADDCPYVKLLYLETGDTQELPLLCQYPVKAVISRHVGIWRCQKPQIMAMLQDFISRLDQFQHIRKADSQYLTCENSECQQEVGEVCLLTTWSGSITFRLINIRSDVTDLGPASSFGWHDPGFIHTAILTGLSPSTSYEYLYGSNKVGWSRRNNFRTPPAPGATEVKVIMLSDMGKNERDSSNEHYLQEGALDVINAVRKEVDAGDVAAIFHTGDISYATDFLVEWDAFLEMINPVASRVPYMTASGNHERDFPESGSIYPTPDSGGEFGVPHETYFQMPSQGPDRPWYSLEYGPIHFTMMSTEMEWTPGSEQYTWLEKDPASVNRSRTPWIIFSGPLLSSVVADSVVSEILRAVDSRMALAIVPLLVQYKVETATWGHVHQYERTCATQNSKCVYKPTKNVDGIDIYSPSSFAGPVHVIIGMTGFHLDGFEDTVC